MRALTSQTEIGRRVPVEIAATLASAFRNAVPYSPSARRAWLSESQDDHHRVAAVAVDEIEGAGEAGFGGEGGNHLVGDDLIHLGAALGDRAAFDQLCVHGGQAPAVVGLQIRSR